MFKKLTLTLLALSFVFTYAFAEGNEVDKKEKPSIESKTEDKKSPKCRASCSMTFTIDETSTTIYGSGGNWFTSCETAESRCRSGLTRRILLALSN